MAFAIPPRPSLHFPSKFEWFPLWILPKLSVISPFGFSVITDSSFCSPKYQVIPPQAINNGRSLTALLSHFTDQNECLNVAFWQTINHWCVLIKDWTLYYYYKKMYTLSLVMLRLLMHYPLFTRSLFPLKKNCTSKSQYCLKLSWELLASRSLIVET